MENSEVYQKRLEDLIVEQLPYLSRREARFRHVDSLPLIGRHFAQHQHDCAGCLACRKELDKLVEDLPRMLGQQVRTYEDCLEKWRKHLKEKHQIYPEDYFNYRYVTIGLIVGLALGSFACFLFYQAYHFTLFSSITMIALITGYMIGLQKDGELRKNKRNF